MKHLWNYAVFIMVLTFQRLIACTVPSLDENVSSSCSPGTSVSYNNQCSFSCLIGYNLIGASTVTCTSSGYFSEPFPECLVTCTVPPLQDNVTSSCSPNTSVSYNERCNFSWPTGYNRAGPSSVTCTSSGSFSEPFPECEVIACTVPSLDENVSSSCSSGTSVSYSDLCSFSCPNGYSRAGPSSVICTGSGSFSEPFPRCVACNPDASVCSITVITCTVPSLEENVSSSCSAGTSLSYNQQCNFSCPPGYSRVGPSSVTCTSSGSFSEPFPECVEITCTVPALAEKVTSSCSPNTSVSYNERCNFSCPTGYTLAGLSSVTCTSSGSFSEPFPECEVIACTVPSLEVRVSSSCSPGTLVSYNQQCNFSCPTGYSLTDSSSVTCTIYGSFSEAFPRCEVIACTVPSLEENVFSSCSSGDPVSYNRQCHFVCQTGYSLTGPPSVTCTDSESFSQMFPRCEDNPVTCLVPSLEENVFSSCSPCTSVSYDERCSFSCATGYNLIGASNVTCTSSGSFSEPFPRCEDIDNCSSDPCMNGGVCTNGLNTYTCACASGFTGKKCETDCENTSAGCKTENVISTSGIFTLSGSTGRRKRGAVPIGSPVVQNLLDSIVNAVDSLPEVISVNGRATSANDDTIDLITAMVSLNVIFRSDITIQQLTSLVIASINNIPGVDVQSFELLTDPCSLDNPCGNGDTCVRVEPGSAKVTCTESTIDTDMATLGVLIGLIVVVVALLLYAVTITVLLIQLRRKVPTKTEENGPDPYMDLEHRPEADRTYQEMAITSTASSTRPGERRLPSSNLIYENQNVASNEITEGVDYEDVITPI